MPTKLPCPMPPWRSARVVPLALALLLAHLPARAWATPADGMHHAVRLAGRESLGKLSEADLHFRRGVELYDDGDLSAALVEFSRAYQIVPHYKILYNLGQVTYERQDYVQSLDYFRRYLIDGHEGLSRERRQKVEQDIHRIEQRIGHIEVSTRSEDDGTDILLDDVRIGAAPLPGPVSANAGQRRVELARTGGQREVHVLDVVGGETIHTAFAGSAPRLSPDASTAERALGPRDAWLRSEHPREAAPAPPSAARQHIPWLSWTSAGLLAGGAAVTGSLALSASRDLQQRRDGYPLMPGDLDGPEKRARVLAMTTDGLLVGALVMTAVSLYLTVSTPAAESDAHEKVGSAIHAARSHQVSRRQIVDN